MAGCLTEVLHSQALVPGLPASEVQHAAPGEGNGSKDDSSKPMYLSAFLGYQAGMTHVVRKLDRPWSKVHKKEVVEVVSIVETMPFMTVGNVGCTETL